MRYNKDGSPDKRQGNGGHGKGGRKTKAEEMGLKEVLMDKMPFEELIQLIAEQAKKGNYQAQKDLLDRYVGKEPKPIITESTLNVGRGTISSIFNPFNNETEHNDDEPDTLTQ